jgi:hypothetical protein
MKAYPTHKEEGMELRDYFAAKAMQAIVNKYGLGYEDGNAIKAYEIADIMMKARNGYTRE